MLKQLRMSNAARQAAWPGAEAVDLAFRGLELGGEVGELLNLLKKLVRVQRGIQGQLMERHYEQTQALRADIADELADVVICADLVAMDLGIDLTEAVPVKFDKTSHKAGVPVFFGHR